MFDLLINFFVFGIVFLALVIGFQLGQHREARKHARNLQKFLDSYSEVLHPLDILNDLEIEKPYGIADKVFVEEP